MGTNAVRLTVPVGGNALVVQMSDVQASSLVSNALLRFSTTATQEIPTVEPKLTAQSPVLLQVWGKPVSHVRRDYLISDWDAVITADDEPRNVTISPGWLAGKKDQLRAFHSLAPNWDSYGAVPTAPVAVNWAEELLQWFAVADMPPPDLFATVDGGVQIEWHIYGLNAEIEIRPNRETEIYYHDLRTQEEWVKPLSAESAELQSVRRRLLNRNA